MARGFARREGRAHHRRRPRAGSGRGAAVRRRGSDGRARRRHRRRRAQHAAEEIGGQYLHLDVASEEEWDTVVADVVATHGRLDMLINNAGIFRCARLVHETVEQWDLVWRSTRPACSSGCGPPARAMIEAGNGGSIVNISSVAGLEGIFGSMAYSASKWAVRGMTKVAAKELGRYGIRVNSIHPGLIDTADDGRVRRHGRRRQAAPGRTADAARPGRHARGHRRMALFLAGDASSYCTGQEFVVDGGVHG